MTSAASDEPDDVHDVRELCQRFRLSEPTVRRNIKNGIWPFASIEAGGVMLPKVGGKWRASRRRVDEVLGATGEAAS